MPLDPVSLGLGIGNTVLGLGRAGQQAQQQQQAAQQQGLGQAIGGITGSPVAAQQGPHPLELLFQQIQQQGGSPV